MAPSLRLLRQEPSSPTSRDRTSSNQLRQPRAQSPPKGRRLSVAKDSKETAAATLVAPLTLETVEKSAASPEAPPETRKARARAAQSAAVVPPPSPPEAKKPEVAVPPQVVPPLKQPEEAVASKPAAPQAPPSKAVTPPKQPEVVASKPAAPQATPSKAVPTPKQPEVVATKPAEAHPAAVPAPEIPDYIESVDSGKWAVFGRTNLEGVHEGSVVSVVVNFERKVTDATTSIVNTPASFAAFCIYENETADTGADEEDLDSDLNILLQVF